MTVEKGGFLDLLSTSQALVKTETQKEIEFQLEQSHAIQEKNCENNAPCICIRTSTGWMIVQGNCNSWTCPRCGQIRARTEYVRIVHGAEELHSKGIGLNFMTLTCRGGNLNTSEAETYYMKWCNAFLTKLRGKIKRDGGTWAYAAVTERQSRGAPHSHLLITAVPNDAILYTEMAELPDGRFAPHTGLWSDYIYNAIQASGLGRIYDMTIVRSPKGAATYISKYLFKSTVSTVWPKGWRRVRYSHSWPKSPIEDTGEAFPLVVFQDWLKVSKLSGKVVTTDNYVYEKALARLITNVELIHNSCETQL